MIEIQTGIKKLFTVSPISPKQWTIKHIYYSFVNNEIKVLEQPLWFIKWHNSIHGILKVSIKATNGTKATNLPTCKNVLKNLYNFLS